jgi:hypothetical protein
MPACPSEPGLRSTPESRNGSSDSPDRLPEELIGHHLEQAFRYLGELGTPYERVARRAATYLVSAGRMAWDREDARAAVDLLLRAVALFPPNDQKGTRLLPFLGEALDDIGRYEDGGLVLEEAVAAAVGHGDSVLESRARMFRLFHVYMTDMATDDEKALVEIEGALAVYERHDDD